jgi:hypothetical protein
MKAVSQIKFNTPVHEGEKNTPFTETEIKEWKEAAPGKRDTILNNEPNRKARRLKETTVPVQNNRPKTKGRKGNRVFMKMAAFALSIHNKKYNK